MAVVSAPRLVRKQDFRPFDELGVSGLKRWGGVLDEEFLRELRGPKGVATFREMALNDSMVGASLFAYETLLKSVDFRFDAADDSTQAREIADFFDTALFEDMSMSWRETLSEILSMLAYGWSYHEVVYKRRGGPSQDPASNSRYNDSRIGWRKWAPRSQETLSAWVFDEAGGLQGFEQRAEPDYRRVVIPIEKAILFRTTSRKSSPEGQSILRTSYVPWYYKRRMQVIRGIGVERDLAGLPVLTPPEGVDLWNPNDSTGVATKATAEKLVRSIRRDEHEGVLKPNGWTLELLASSGSRQFDITTVIGQLNTEIAMSMMTDFLLVGHGEVGARSLSEDKRKAFSDAAGSFLTGIVDTVNRHAVPRLVELNGWPQELAPKLAHGPVSQVGLDQLSQYLERVSKAGLVFPDEGLERHLRERAHLPPPEEVSE